MQGNKGHSFLIFLWLDRLLLFKILLEELLKSVKTRILYVSTPPLEFNGLLLFE